VRTKLWIHLVGLLSFFAWGLAATLFWASMITPDATRTNISILIFMSFAGAGLLTLIWAVFSVVQSLDHPAGRQGAA
jgi:hypothetical protein